VEITKPKFSIGQLVHHTKFDYRGVVVDIDPVFMGTDEWYDQVAQSRPPKDKPWYRVLVHDASHETYVAERHLEEDSESTPINHPLVDTFFHDFEQGRYQLNMRVN